MAPKLACVSEPFPPRATQIDHVHVRAQLFQIRDHATDLSDAGDYRKGLLSRQNKSQALPKQATRMDDNDTNCPLTHGDS